VVSWHHKIDAPPQSAKTRALKGHDFSRAAKPQKRPGL
jgi:hypothetical protein